jgi:anti-sigma B factor antagonist
MFSKSLQITAELGAREGTRILHLNGPLDMETTLEFQGVVRAESSPVLIVDFGGVPYMDSAGLGAIVGAYVSAQKAQRRIALTGMNERLRALVELNRLSKILATYTSIAEAETALH